jgi:hypothetical protein
MERLASARAGALADQAHAYIFTNDRNEPDARGAAEAAGLDFHRLLIWDKVAATPNRWYQQTCEFVLFMKKGKAYRIANPSTKSLQSLNSSATNPIIRRKSRSSFAGSISKTRRSRASSCSIPSRDRERPASRRSCSPAGASSVASSDPLV